MGPSTDPPAGPALEDLDQLCAKEELDLAASQHLATTRADVDADPDLAAYAEAELERVGQEAWQVWNSTRPANTRKAYAKGKRVWYEWCRLRGFRDGPLVRELKVVLWLKEYVLRLTTTHRKRGVNRPSGLLKAEDTVQQHDKAASAGKSLGPYSGRNRRLNYISTENSADADKAGRASKFGGEEPRQAVENEEDEETGKSPPLFIPFLSAC
jgi:hypothetical protein